MKRTLTCFFFILCFLFSQAQKQQYKVAIVAFYNLENFYDTVDNPIVNDDEFTPKGDKNYNTAIYFNKVEHLATVISQIGTDVNPDGPALLGVAEIENDTVLNDLINQKLIKDRNYHYVHYDSRDLRGVDVGLIYNPKYFTVEDSKKLFVVLPSGSKTSFLTRDVLWVKGKLNGETVHVFVNHWPSRLGGEERSAPARAAAARVDKNFMDSIQKEDPEAKIIMMGDLNDDPISPSLTKVIGAVGDPEKVKARRFL